ncbi:MAG: hypothetical protein ACSLE6_06180 [Mycobacterium sp.]
MPTADVVDATGVDDVAGGAGRVIVVGAAADLAAVLTRLMRTERLDVEVAHATGARTAARARNATAQRIPLIRDDTGYALAGAAYWLPVDGSSLLEGEGIVDDTVLFDGTAAGVRIEPTSTLPGLRATIVSGGRRPVGFGTHWVVGRAAQLGTAGAVVVRDAVTGPRTVRRSTFYRHTQGWLRVG